MQKGSASGDLHQGAKDRRRRLGILQHSVTIKAGNFSRFQLSP